MPKSNSNDSLNEIKKMLAGFINEASDSMGLDIEATLDEKKSQENINKSIENLETPKIKVEAEVEFDNNSIQKKAKEINDILNNAFSVSGKKNAANQLRQTFRDFSGVLDHENPQLSRSLSESGLEAGLAYCRSLKNAIKENVADSIIIKNTDSVFKTFSGEINIDEIEAAENEYSRILGYYNEVYDALARFGDIDITKPIDDTIGSIADQIKEYVYYKDLAFSRNENVGDLFSAEDVEQTESIAKSAFEMIMSFAEMMQEEMRSSTLSVKDFFDQFGSVGQALDNGAFADLNEVIKVLGKNLSELDLTGLSQNEIDTLFAEQLIKDLELSEDELKVVRALLLDIKTIQEDPSGDEVHRYQKISNDLETIYSIASGTHFVSDEDIQNANKLLNIVENVEETSSEKRSESDTKAARKRLTEQARYYLNKANERTIDYSEVEAQFNRIISEMQQLGESTAHVEEQFARAKAAFNMDGVAEEAEKGAEAVTEEAEAFEKIEPKAKKATKSKSDFNKKNKETKQGALDGAEAIGQEAEAFNEFPENPTLLKFLQEIQEGTNTIEFSVAIDKEMALSELRKIAPEIADAFNSQYGTNIDANQVVKAYQQAQKEIDSYEKASNKQAIADAMNLSKIQKQQNRDNKKALEERNKALKRGSQQEKQANDEALTRQQKQATEYAKEQFEYEKQKQAILDEADNIALLEQQKQATEYEKEQLEYEKQLTQYRQNGENQNIDYSNSLYSKMESNLKDIYDLKNKNAKIDKSTLNGQSQIESNQKEINTLQNRNNEIAQEIVVSQATQISKDEELVSLVQKRAEELRSIEQTVTAGQVDNLGSSLESYLKKVQSVADSTKFTKKFRAYFVDFRDSLENISTEVNKIDLSNLDSGEVEKLIQRFNDLKKSIDEALGDKGLSENKAAARSSLAKLKKSIEDIIDLNSNMGKAYKDRFLDLEVRVDTAKSNADVEQLKAEIVELNAEIIKVGKNGKSSFQKFKEAIATKNTQFFAQYFSWQDWIRYARELSQNVINIDSALTELRKVSDATNVRLQQSFEKSADTALELGQSIQHVVNVTADWARLGYDVDAAEDLARVTALFTTVGDNMTADDASSYLISTLQGYHMVADEAEHIVDVYNAVANSFAIDTAGIGEALQRSAASFDAANTSLEKSVALVTATNTVVQDPSSVGTLWKTMSARIRGAKTELEELGEEEDEFTQTTSKLQSLVKGLTGFDILEEDGETFKDIYDIVLGIGKEWKNLTDIEQASLGEALAGKRNANALYAVLNNIETLEDAYDTAQHSAESAAKEQENYAKSVQYSLDRLQASIEKISFDALNSQALKEFIEFGVNAIDVLDSLMQRIDNLPALIAGVGTAYVSLQHQFTPQSISDFLGHAPNIKADIDVFNEAMKSTDQTVLDFAEGMKVGQDSLSRYLNTVKGSNASFSGYISSLVGATAKTVALEAATMALNAAISFGLSVAITALVSGITNLIQKQREARQEAIDIMEAFDAENDSINEQIEKIEELNDQLKDSSTTESDIKGIKDKLLSIQNDLNDKYKKEAEQLDLVNGKYEDQLTILKNISAQKANNIVDLNREEYDKANKFLSKRKTGNFTRGVDVDDLALENLIRNRYSDVFNLTEDSFGGEYLLTLDVSYEEAENELQRFTEDLSKLEDETGQDYTVLFNDISDYLDSLANDEKLQSNKKIVQEYTSALIISNSQLSEAYSNAEDAIENYNEALSSGEDVDKAKENLDKAKEVVDGLTIDDSRVQKSFDDLWDSINKSAEKKYEYTQQLTEAATQIDLVDSYKDELSELERYLEKEQSKLSKYDVDTSKTLFGNVNLDDTNRYIEWTTENIEKYRDAIESWGDDADDYLGTYSTVDATSMEMEGVEFAVTPMMMVDGKAEFLDADTVDNYISAVLKEAKGDYSLDNIINIDAKGLEIDGRKVKGIIADVGESAQQTSEIMHYLGENGSIEHTEKSIQELNAKIKDTSSITSEYLSLIKGDELSEFDLTDNFENLDRVAKVHILSFLNYLGLTKDDLKMIVPILQELGILIDKTGESATNTVARVRSTIVDSVTDLNTKLQGQFSNLGELYNNIFTSDGFTKKNITNDALNTIVEDFVTKATELGVKTEDAKDAANEFMAVLSREDSTASDVQQAFNKLATSYFYATDSLETLNEATADSIKQQLEQMGVVNADEVVDAYLSLAEAYQTAMEKGLDLKTASKAQIDALIQEGNVAADTAQQMYLYAYQKQAANADNLTTTASVQALLNLAYAANITGPALDALLQLLSQFGTADDWAAKGMTATANYVRKQAIEAYKTAMAGISEEPLEVKFPTNSTGASGAGKSDADAYVEAYEEEKKKLERDRDMGLISEKEYLDKLRELIDRFFKDRAAYAENYMDEMKDYMDALLSHYNSVISGVTTLLDRRISSLEKQKDSAVSSLEAEQEAAEAAYQAEIDALQEEIDAIDEKIDAIDDEIDGLNDEIDKYNDMIDAINEANDAREREINLSKALYELQRAQNQRTKLVYTGEKNQMRYERDESAVRDAQEQVKDAQDEIAIAAIEKQISLLEDEIELLEDQKEALQDQQEALQKQQEQIQKAMEASSKYYENLIKETENYWDAMIEALENTKSKWEELAETESVAKAWGLVADEMAEFGYTVEDVLNDTPGAFDAFKNAYLGVLTDMHSGDQGFLDGLKATTGQIPEQYDKISQAATEAKTPINELGSTAETATGKVSTLGTTASTAAGGVGELKTQTDGVVSDVKELQNVQLDALVSALKDIATHLGTIAGTDLSDIVSKLNSMDTTVDDGFVMRYSDFADALIAIGQVILTTLASDLDKIKTATDGTTVSNVQQIQSSLDLIQQVSISQLVTDFTTLQGLVTPIAEALNGIEGKGGIVTALQTLQGITLDDNIVAQFNNLEKAVNNVSNAINGGGSSESEESGSGTTANVAGGDRNQGGESEEGSASGLVGAIESVKQATTDNIGSDPTQEDGTAIGHFNALGKAIETITTEKIGVVEEEGGEVAPTTLIGSFGALSTSAQEKIPKVVSEFDKLKKAIEDCITKVGELIEKISLIHLPEFGKFTGTALNYRGTATPHFQGTAKYTGDWSVGRNEKSLVGELGPEIVYLVRLCMVTYNEKFI